MAIWNPNHIISDMNRWSPLISEVSSPNKNTPLATVEVPRVPGIWMLVQLIMSFRPCYWETLLLKLENGLTGNCIADPMQSMYGIFTSNVGKYAIHACYAMGMLWRNFGQEQFADFFVKKLCKHCLRPKHSLKQILFLVVAWDWWKVILTTNIIS